MRLRWESRYMRRSMRSASFFFAYFYMLDRVQSNEVADNMRKWGGSIPGIRPGKRTADYINDVLTRITLVGALYS